MAEFNLENPNGKFVDKTISNTKSNLIEITEDKLENILLKHAQNVFNSTAWVTPFALSLTILVVFLTADFKSFLGIDKNIWQAIFIVGFISCLIWTGFIVTKAIKNKSKASIEFLIEQIKNSSPH